MLRNIVIIFILATCCIQSANSEGMMDVAPYNPNAANQSSGAQSQGLDMKWKQAAIFQLRSLMNQSAQNIASSVQGITHPTGNNPHLLGYNVLTLQDRIMVQITVGWFGGLSGSRYQTSLNWELTPSSHLAATVTGDNAPYAIKEQNKLMLSNYFRDSVYPVFQNNMEVVSNTWK